VCLRANRRERKAETLLRIETAMAAIIDFSLRRAHARRALVHVK
jgi:hypothetical protein